MSQILSPKLRRNGDMLMHWCPGCNARHMINIVRDDCGPAWDWDGSVDAPTFHPSINIVRRCHYFITGGLIQFCSDSTHALAGQIVPLPDFPEGQ
jgi:hypothetical protein